MSQVIQELLLLSQVRRYDVASQPLDMAAVLSEAQARLWPMVAESAAEIVVHDLDQWPTACGYAPWVEEIWYNYISNALKYGGRPPRVEIGADPHADGAATFWVRDDGPGLSPEQVDQLFVEFSRVSTSPGSHGLGLSIVKRIVDKLGGTVSVRSTQGAGATFCFTLPLAPCP
jgi:signal transduction histidine kinase